jgi:branched-chain amino acid transport system permease protein
MEHLLGLPPGSTQGLVAAICEVKGGMATFLGLLSSALSQGAIIALAALGFLLMYKATGVISFAHGDMITMGVYLAIWLVQDHGWPYLAGYFVAIAMMFVVGVVTERIAYAPLRGRSVHVVVIATFGAAIAVRALLGIWQGTTPRGLYSPLKNKTWSVDGAVIPKQRILILVVTVLVVVAMLWLFNRTQFGRQVRAVADDTETARLQGVAVNRMSMIAFGLATALAGLAGVLIGPSQSVDLNLGFGVMLGGFAAAVLGGFGSLGGVVIGGFLIGIAEQLFGGYCARDYKSAYPFILMILVIAFRPQGLFSRGGAHERL